MTWFKLEDVAKIVRSNKAKHSKKPGKPFNGLTARLAKKQAEEDMKKTKK
jgi:hypothetical protein